MKCDFSGFCSVRNCTKWLLTLKVADPRPKRPRLHPLNSIHQQWRRRLLHPLQKHGGNLQVFALRTLVWEGMGLSCSLHPDLSGFGWNGNICSLLSLRTFILKDPHQKWRCWSFRKRTVCGQSGDCQRGRSYRTGRVCRVNSDLWCRFSVRSCPARSRACSSIQLWVTMWLWRSCPRAAGSTAWTRPWSWGLCRSGPWPHRWDAVRLR